MRSMHEPCWPRMLHKARRNACQSSVLTQPSTALSNRATLQSNSELSVFDSARLINFVGLQPLVIICRRRVRVRRRGDRVDARHGARPEVRCGEGVSARRRRRRAPRGDQVARVAARVGFLPPPLPSSRAPVRVTRCKDTWRHRRSLELTSSKKKLVCQRYNYFRHRPPKERVLFR